MSTSAPEVTQPVTFPARFAWLQHRIRHHVRPYHVVIAALAGLINFNVLGWME
jgi:hypothetical protein